MIGLAILLLRLCAVILKLTARLLGIAVRWGMVAMRRCPTEVCRETSKEPIARTNPAMPSRRRAFTAPPRARRTTA